MSTERQQTIFLVIVGIVGVLIGFAMAHDQYVRECFKSGHTESYCEMEFWK